MPAPKRVIVSVDDINVSAFLIPPLDYIADGKPVCKYCAPRRTRMTLIVEVRRVLRDGYEVWSIYSCSWCEKQWAVPWIDARTTSGQS